MKWVISKIIDWFPAQMTPERILPAADGCTGRDPYPNITLSSWNPVEGRGKKSRIWRFSGTQENQSYRINKTSLIGSQTKWSENHGTWTALCMPHACMLWLLAWGVCVITNCRTLGVSYSCQFLWPFHSYLLALSSFDKGFYLVFLNIFMKGFFDIPWRPSILWQLKKEQWTRGNEDCGKLEGEEEVETTVNMYCMRKE